MPEEFNISDHFNSDGTVNADGPGLHTLAGPDHAESKCFEDVKDFQSLVKLTADTKSLTGKQAKQIENSIQNIGENATDDEIAAHRSQLNKARGAPESGSEYEFARPEGVPYNEKREAEFREFMFANEVPKDTAKTIWDWYSAIITGDHTDLKKTETDALDKQRETLRTDWPGQAMIEKPRLALNALMELGSELYPNIWKDFEGPSGQTIKGSKNRILDAKLGDSPGDLEKWFDCGFDTGQIRQLEVLGRRMQIKPLLNSEGGGTGGASDIEQAQKNRINAENRLSPGMQVE